MGGEEGGRGVHDAGGDGCLFDELPDAGGVGGDLVGEGGERAVRTGAQAHAVQGGRAVADDGREVAPGQGEGDGTAGVPCGHDREDDVRAGVPLQPKAPPTCSETTVTRSAGSPKREASVERTSPDPWLESYTVRVPASASQWAVAACGSMGWLCSGGTAYAQSTRTGAAASAAAASPFSRWAG